MSQETGCDGVLIGRGAMGNPWLFGQIAQMLQPSGVPLNLFIRAALGIVYLLMLGRMTYLAGQGRMLFFERISGTRLKNLIRS